MHPQVCEASTDVDFIRDQQCCFARRTFTANANSRIVCVMTAKVRAHEPCPPEPPACKRRIVPDTPPWSTMPKQPNHPPPPPKPEKTVKSNKQGEREDVRVEHEADDMKGDGTIIDSTVNGMEDRLALMEEFQVASQESLAGMEASLQKLVDVAVTNKIIHEEMLNTMKNVNKTLEAVYGLMRAHAADKVPLLGSRPKAGSVASS